LIQGLRASEVVINRALDSLVAAGLVLLEHEVVTYRPVNANLAACVQQTESLYVRRPNSVRRAIVSAQISGAAAFAEAFRLRRDKDE
jgi:hypothetical protein